MNQQFDNGSQKNHPEGEERGTQRASSSRPPFQKRRSFSDRPPFDRDRERRGGFNRERSEGGEERGGAPRRFSSSRPPFQKRRSFSDRPPFDRDRERGGFNREHSEGGEERGGAPRRFSSSRPPFQKRRSFSDRPPFDRDRERGGFNRERSEGGEERRGAPRRFSSSRPPFQNRRSFSDRPYSDRDGNSFPDRRNSFSKPRFNKWERSPEKEVTPEDHLFAEGLHEMREAQPQDDNIEIADMATEESAAQKQDIFPMPLNKYIAHCGVCSRRAAVDKVKEGIISVNDIVVTEPGYKVSENDVVEMNKKPLSIQDKLVYILLNKPKGYICTSDDELDRKTIFELTKHATESRIHSVGRLDRDTMGVILLTNDGDLTQRLTHPSSNISKLYHVELDKPLLQEHMQELADGIELEDGSINADDIAYPDASNKKEVGVAIHSGRNHIIKRMFEHLGYEVVRLDRVLFAGLTKKNVPRGKWRFLEEKETRQLKYFQVS